MENDLNLFKDITDDYFFRIREQSLNTIFSRTGSKCITCNLVMFYSEKIMLNNVNLPSYLFPHFIHILDKLLCRFSKTKMCQFFQFPNYI